MTQLICLPMATGTAIFAAPGNSVDRLTLDPRFPFYGQPIDMKIVIDGAVAESRPADINAQTAWMLRWGWIPQYHGSLITGADGRNGGTSEPGRIAVDLQSTGRLPLPSRGQGQRLTPPITCGATSMAVRCRSRLACPFPPPCCMRAKAARLRFYSSEFDVSSMCNYPGR